MRIWVTRRLSGSGVSRSFVVANINLNLGTRETVKRNEKEPTSHTQIKSTVYPATTLTPPGIKKGTGPDRSDSVPEVHSKRIFSRGQGRLPGVDATREV